MLEKDGVHFKTSHFLLLCWF